MAEEAEAAAAAAPVALALHETIQTLQLEHGLRFADHQRYRRFCSRRLRRLRQTLGLPCARGKAYVGGEVTPETATTPGHFLLVLLLAERAWAYAMDLKTEANGGEEWRRGLDRRQFVRRMAKADKWATLLLEIAEARGDERTRAEARCYATWMGGHHALEKEQFQTALERFTETRGLMRELSRSGSVEDEDLFGRRIEALTPAVRWCAYNLGEPDPTADEEVHVDAADGSLASKLADATLRDTAGTATTQVQWGARSLAIIPSQSDAVKVGLLKAFQGERDLQDLHGVLARRGQTPSPRAAAARIGLVASEAPAGAAAEDAPADEAGVAAEEAKIFSGIFDALDAAERAVDKELQQFKAMAAGDRVDSTLAAATGLKAAIAWRRMEHMLHRNLRLALGLEAKWEKEARAGWAAVTDDANPVDDLVHMYEIMRVLSHDMEEVHSVKDHEELYQRALATQATTRCYRCFFLAESYVKGGRFGDANRLFTHCQNLTGDAIEAGRAVMEAIVDAAEPDAETQRQAWEDAVRGVIQLEQRCTGAKSRVLALVYLQRHQKGSALPGGAAGLAEEDDGTAPRRRDLMDRLDDFDDGGGRSQGWRLQSVPPKLRALPGKPLFLDIASHYLQFPNLDEKAGVPPEQHVSGPGGEAGKGWLTWLTG